MAKKKQSHPAEKHPDILEWQNMIRRSIDEIKSEYAHREIPEKKQEQINKLEEKIANAPWEFENILPEKYRSKK
jgi:hypothetical protein